MAAGTSGFESIIHECTSEPCPLRTAPTTLLKILLIEKLTIPASRSMVQFSSDQVSCTARIHELLGLV